VWCCCCCSSHSDHFDLRSRLEPRHAACVSDFSSSSSSSDGSCTQHFTWHSSAAPQCVVFSMQQETLWHPSLLPWLPTHPHLSLLSYNNCYFHSTTPSQTRFEAYLPTSSSDTADYQLSSSSSNTSPYSCVASGPGWHVALETAELSELVHMLVQLRMAVASLQYQGLWRAGKEERPPSRAKVGEPSLQFAQYKRSNELCYTAAFGCAQGAFPCLRSATTLC
jgi:hypothetical protein